MSLVSDRTNEALFMLLFTVFALVEAFVFQQMFFAIAWAAMAVIHLLAFEWKTNPDRYGWFGKNPNLAAAGMMVPVLIYWVVGAIVVLF